MTETTAGERAQAGQNTMNRHPDYVAIAALDR
jgi:hypothetical protein